MAISGAAKRTMAMLGRRCIMSWLSVPQVPGGGEEQRRRPAHREPRATREVGTADETPSVEPHQPKSSDQDTGSLAPPGEQQPYPNHAGKEDEPDGLGGRRDCRRRRGTEDDEG